MMFSLLPYYTCSSCPLSIVKYVSITVNTLVEEHIARAQENIAPLQQTEYCGETKLSQLSRHFAGLSPFKRSRERFDSL